MADDEMPHVDPPPETRRCAVCGSERASFGFGPPGVSEADAWYCAEHRAEGERRWAARYRPQPTEAPAPSLLWRDRDGR